jgi:hypothetical protein
MRLGDLARLIRSKNAGPFMLTIDLLFADRESYDRAVSSGLLDRTNIAALYRVPDGKLRLFELPEFLAVKISFPRPVASGTEGDSDIYGCQYMARLARLEIEGVAGPLHD